MGGCATKPKVDTAEPAPEPAKEETSAAETVPEVKEMVVVEREKEVAVDDDNKRQSLSHLFKENEGQGPTEVVETLAETKVIEEMTEIGKPPEVSGVETQAADMAARDVVAVPVEPRTEKAETAEAITETPIPEESKTVEETHVPVVAEIEKVEKVDAETETQTPEKSRTETAEQENVIEETTVSEPEKEKIETVDAETETQNPEKSSTKAAEQETVIEETPVAEPEKAETKTTLVSEKVEGEIPKEEKAEEEKLASETQVPETSEEKKVLEETKSAGIPVEKEAEEEK